MIRFAVPLTALAFSGIAISGLTGHHRSVLAQVASPSVTARATSTPVSTRIPVPEGSPTAVPTPVGTPTTPTALQILSRMHTAVQKQGSLRVSSKISSWIDRNHFVTGQERVDLTWRNTLAEHEHDTWHRTTISGPHRGTVVEQRDLYLLRNVAESRGASNPWYCEHLKNLTVQNLFLPFMVQITRASIVGTSDVNGTPAWHIRASSAWAYTWTNKPVRIDFIITQPDSLLRQMQIRGTSRPPGTASPLQILETYSHYRETLHIKLPSPCSSLLRSAVAQQVPGKHRVRIENNRLWLER